MFCVNIAVDNKMIDLVIIASFTYPGSLFYYILSSCFYVKTAFYFPNIIPKNTQV